MFTLPESGLADLSDDALRELEAEGRNAFNDLDISDESTAEQIAEAEAIADAVDAVRGEMGNREAAATERADKIAQLSERMAEESEEDAEDEPEEDAPVAEEDDEEPEMAAEEAPVEPVAASDETPDTAVVEDTPTVEADVATDIPTEGADVAESTEQPEAVAAAASPSERAAQNAGTPSIPTAPSRLSLVASVAPDVPGIPAGTDAHSIEGIVAAVEARVSRMKGQQGQGYQRFGTLAFNRQFPEELRQDNYRDDTELFEAATRSAKMSSAESLVAAAGWGATSETMYDLCNDTATDGLISLPEFQVSRGGIRYTAGTDYSTVYAGVGFDLTEAEVIAESPTKGSYEVPTPSFVDARLDAVGIVIRAGILQRVGYPEQIADVIAKAMVAHANKVNAKVVAAILAGSGTPLTPVEEGAFYSTLDSLVFIAESIRTKHRLADSRAMEVKLARWVKPTIKADLARRTARPSAAVSDAEVNEWFTSRNLSVEFIYGLDELDTSSALQVGPKAETTALIYPSGTWANGVSDVANLDTIYDSTLLYTNEYTALFVEEGILTVARCNHESAAATLPVSATGMAANNTLDQAFGTVEA